MRPLLGADRMHGRTTSLARRKARGEFLEASAAAAGMVHAPLECSGPNAPGRTPQETHRRVLIPSFYVISKRVVQEID